MLRRSLLIIFILSITISLVLAVDDQGNPNDPTVNERANACYDDGSMGGKCETDWEWVCGWHLIRFEYDLIERADFLAACSSVLPPEAIPEQPATTVSTGSNLICIEFVSGYYLDFSDSNFLFPALIYSDANCSVFNVIETSSPLVNAPDVGAASTICANNGYNDGAVAQGSVYYCSVPA